MFREKYRKDSKSNYSTNIRKNKYGKAEVWQAESSAAILILKDPFANPFFHCTVSHDGEKSCLSAPLHLLL